MTRPAETGLFVSELDEHWRSCRRPLGRVGPLPERGSVTGCVLAPLVLAAPQPVFEFSKLYGGTTRTIPGVSSEIATLDPATQRITHSLHGEFGAQDCLLPRGAAMDEAHGELLVACLGRDEIVAYDARATAPLRKVLRRWKVAPGPRGVAVDREASRAVAWSQFDGVLSLFPLGGTPGEMTPAPSAVPIAAHQALSPELDSRLIPASRGAKSSFTTTRWAAPAVTSAMRPPTTPATTSRPASTAGPGPRASIRPLFASSPAPRRTCTTAAMRRSRS